MRMCRPGFLVMLIGICNGLRVLEYWLCNTWSSSAKDLYTQLLSDRRYVATTSTSSVSMTHLELHVHDCTDNQHDQPSRDFAGVASWFTTFAATDGHTQHDPDRSIFQFHQGPAITALIAIPPKPPACRTRVKWCPSENASSRSGLSTHCHQTAHKVPWSFVRSDAQPIGEASWHGWTPALCMHEIGGCHAFYRRKSASCIIHEVQGLP